MCTPFSTIRGFCLKSQAMKLCFNYLINSTKERHEFAEKSSTQTGNVHKRTLQDRKHTHLRLVMNPKQSRDATITLRAGKLDLQLKTHCSHMKNTYVHLLAQRQTTAQRAGQPNHFGHECFQCEIFLQHHSSENRLHFRNTRP